jgi:hypothetical protein
VVNTLLCIWEILGLLIGPNPGSSEFFLWFSSALPADVGKALQNRLCEHPLKLSFTVIPFDSL